MNERSKRNWGKPELIEGQNFDKTDPYISLEGIAVNRQAEAPEKSYEFPDSKVEIYKSHTLWQGQIIQEQWNRITDLVEKLTLPILGTPEILLDRQDRTREKREDDEPESGGRQPVTGEPIKRCLHLDPVQKCFLETFYLDDMAIRRIIMSVLDLLNSAHKALHLSYREINLEKLFLTAEGNARYFAFEDLTDDYDIALVLQNALRRMAAHHRTHLDIESAGFISADLLEFFERGERGEFIDPEAARGYLKSLKVEPEVFSVTHPGIVRKNNEDSFLVASQRLVGVTPREMHLYAVADGMGGHSSGEIASLMTLDILHRKIALGLEFENKEPDEITPQIAEMIKETNRLVYSYAKGDPRLFGMGTTLTGVILQGHYLHLFNVGDSRCYVAGPGGFIRLSHDHSLVQDMVDKGLITEEEAHTHPERHIITCAIGTTPDLEPQVKTLPVPAGCYLLLCSDGLSDMLRDDEIKDIFVHCEGGEIAQQLTKSANDHGGKDNVTVVLIRLELKRERGLPSGGDESVEFPVSRSDI